MAGKRGTLAERFWRKVTPLLPDECWKWGGSFMRTGYGQMGRGGAGGGMMTAHRASYQINKGDIPEGMCVLHACDNKWCVNPSHLSVGTHSDNNRDRVAKGRNAPVTATRHLGEDHGRAKLSDFRVQAIRHSPTPSPQIAPKYGVSHATICRIRSGSGWKHLNNAEYSNVRNA